MPPLTVGLTGGVASGKSLAARHFMALGVPALDADEVARAVVEPGTPALAQIVARFGPDILQPDGTLHRRRLREIVFQDVAARRDLEAITHPAIGAELQRWRDAQTTPYCLLVVAILVETGLRRLVDRVLVIDVPETVQLARVQGRDGIDPALAQAMLQAQAPRAERLAAADDVIVNDGPPEALQAHVAQMHAFYLRLAAEGRPGAPGLCLPSPPG